MILLMELWRRVMIDSPAFSPSLPSASHGLLWSMGTEPICPWTTIACGLSPLFLSSSS